MTVISTEPSVDAPEAVALSPKRSDDGLLIFFPESQKTNGGSADRVALGEDAMHGRRPSAQFVKPNTKSASDRAAELVNHLKRALGSLDVARDLTKAVDTKFAALKSLEQEVVRLIKSFEPRLADLREKEQDLRAVETSVAACEERAQTVKADLERQVAVCEEREERAVQALEQLESRAADTIADLDRRIELVVPQVGRQLEDLNESLAQQTMKLAANQHLLHRTLDEAQESATVVSRLEDRIADLSRSHQFADVELRVGQFEARAATAASEFAQATRAKNGLEQEVAALQNQLQQMTTAADDEAKKLGDVRQHAERYQREEQHRVSAVLSKLETRLADIGRSHQQLAAVDKHVGHLEQRTAAAATALKQARGAKNALQHEIAELHDQLQRLTKAAQAEAKTLAGLKQQAKRHRLYRASYTQPDDRSIIQQFRRRASRAWRSLTPDRLMVGGVAVALSVAVVVLVGIVWRFSQIQNDTTANPPPPPFLASRTLEFTPIEVVLPLMSSPISGSSQRLNEKRPASVAPPARVAQVVVPPTAVMRRGNATASVREPSVGTAGDQSQFVGTLIIESEPAGATAFVNQQPVGVTPVVLNGLRVRSYAVRVEYEGYQRWSTAVTVSTMHEARVTATLQRDPRR